MAPGIDDEPQEPHRTPREYGMVRHLAEDVQQLKSRFDDFSVRLMLVENLDRRTEDRIKEVRELVVERMATFTSTVQKDIAMLTATVTEDRQDRKDANKWAFRTIATAFILAGVTFIVSGGLKLTIENIGAIFGAK
jgi:hypothetical protein